MVSVFVLKHIFAIIALFCFCRWRHLKVVEKQHHWECAYRREKEKVWKYRWGEQGIEDGLELLVEQRQDCADRWKDVTNARIWMGGAVFLSQAVLYSSLILF